MGALPNLNLSITVHQARIDSSVSSLLVFPQIKVIYKGLAVKSRLGHSALPVWNETFNFEYSDTTFEVFLINNPPLYKEILLGKCVIGVETATGWFEFRDNIGKIGAVRITVVSERIQRNMQGSYLEKISVVQAEQEKLRVLKKKYAEKLNKFKEKNSSGKENSISEKEPLEISQKQVILRMQEQGISQEKNKIQEAWTQLALEKKEIEEKIAKVQSGYSEFQVAKSRLNLQTRISEYSKPRVSTPKSCKSGSDY